MNGVLLEGTAEGERLRLAGAGAWVAENAHSLEAQVNAATQGGGTIKRVIIDMTRVDRLDTFGAWLLERLTAQLFRARMRYGGGRAHGRLPRAGRRGAWRPAGAGTGAPPRQFARRCGRLGRREHRRCRRFARRYRQHAGRADGRVRARRDAPAPFPLHLDGAPARQCRLAGGADHPADHLSDRRHHRAAGHFPFPQIRRRHLRRRHGRHPGAARDRRADRRHHGGGPLRQRLYRRTRLDEDARGGRRAAHHGLRSDRGADPAAHRGADHRRADPHFPRIAGGALWRRAGVLALWRHQPRHLPVAAERSDLARHLRGRHDQGAVHGSRDRRGGLRRRHGREGLDRNRSGCRPPLRSSSRSSW